MHGCRSGGSWDERMGLGCCQGFRRKTRLLVSPVTDSLGDLGGVAFLCPRLTFPSVKWVVQGGRVINFVLQNGCLQASVLTKSRVVCLPEAVDELSELTLSGHMVLVLVRTAALEAENLVVFFLTP